VVSAGAQAAVDSQASQGQAPTPIPLPPSIAAEPITLKELIEKARTIVQGTVSSIEFSTLDLDETGTRVSVRVRHVQIAIARALKGEGLRDGGTLRVTQSVDESAPLAVGDEILWYLPAPSRFGLIQPLGLYSGDFRITGAPLAKQASNLQGNVGLWEQSVWSGDDSFEQTKVLAAARAMAMPETSVSEIASVGAASRPPGAVPLNLLLSITSAATQPR